ncbi:hypothetical protein EVAR_103538_1 [Eumeta japonica]|uniref:Uncharacterized protein n=1 Tax=Eumeta variegata TaxID=151549 RepID=A0A4C1YK48_EUMVA|nr:hypothetical protein EVAR_103538_1 [Eumeta japonica]
MVGITEGRPRSTRAACAVSDSNLEHAQCAFRVTSGRRRRRVTETPEMAPTAKCHRIDSSNENTTNILPPEEIVPAEQLVVPGVALVGERRAAVGAAHASRVPGALQHVQQELVQDRLLAAGAGHGRAAARPASCSRRAAAKVRRLKPDRTAKTYPSNYPFRTGVGNLRLASHMRLFGCEAAAL